MGDPASEYIMASAFDLSSTQELAVDRQEVDGFAEENAVIFLLIKCANRERLCQSSSPR